MRCVVNSDLTSIFLMLIESHLDELSKYSAASGQPTNNFGFTNSGHCQTVLSPSSETSLFSETAKYGGAFARRQSP